MSTKINEKKDKKKQKLISIVIPCYNEEDNIQEMANVLINKMESIKKYDYELIFIDNDSKDNSRNILRKICQKNKRIKAIFNKKNFGQFNSPYYGMCQANGDCVILICCDFQDPVDMIDSFINEWENGFQVVCAQKTSSQENKIIYLFRSLYYKMIKKFSNIDLIEHFTGFGLYDKSFIEILRRLDDSTPFLRGIVAEYASPIKIIEYKQNKRKAGKSSNNFFTLYDAAMLSFTSYTKVGMRLASFMGMIFAFISFVIAIVYLIMKLIYWDTFIAGSAPSLIMVSLMASLILIMLGFIGEYISSINTRVMHRPLVIEEERINFKK